MDAWIDTYHAVRSLTREGTPVFLTDSAVGLKEEDNLRHLVSNLGSEVSRRGVVPFLTCKHELEHCTAYADRAVQHGFPALVVLGGDKSVGPPRCVAHAWQLREEIRKHQPQLLLGGWANPHGNSAQQVGHLLDEHATAEFYLTQIVRITAASMSASSWRRPSGVDSRSPGSSGSSTIARPIHERWKLESFLPVPAEQLTAEFAAGATADEIAQDDQALREAGARHFYISNLPLQRAARTLRSILSKA